jgi:hypothetical protein
MSSFTPAFLHSKLLSIEMGSTYFVKKITLLISIKMIEVKVVDYFVKRPVGGMKKRTEGDLGGVSK